MKRIGPLLIVLFVVVPLFAQNFHGALPHLTPESVPFKRTSGAVPVNAFRFGSFPWELHRSFPGSSFTFFPPEVQPGIIARLRADGLFGRRHIGPVECMFGYVKTTKLKVENRGIVNRPRGTIGFRFQF